MEKATKKRIKRYLTWVCLAGLVLLLTVMPLLAQQEAEADGPQASILSATVETGSITTSLRGGGTLEDQDEMDVILPTGVKITEFLVKNGDIVAEGTPLATVDKISVMAAISSVNDTMKYLQSQMEEGREEKVADSITAVPGGRVKKIFAQEGEEVQEVMLRDGALAVLSIDSMMAVQVEAKSTLATGEDVEVTLADGTILTGRVESNLDGVVIVTVEDEGYEVGQEVSVRDLGTGALYIHNAWKVTAHTGTISKIMVKEEQTLKAGAKVFTLTDRDFTGQLQHRANQHREYARLLQDLLKMYESGTLTAPCEGIVSGVDTDSVHLLSGDGTWQIELLSASGDKQYQILFLENSEPDTSKCENKEDCPVTTPANHVDSCPRKCTIEEGCKARDNEHFPECNEACIETKNPEDHCPANNHKATCIHSCQEADTVNVCNSNVHKKSCIQGCDGSESCTSDKHRGDCIKLCKRSDGSFDCPAQNHYDDCIERCSRESSEKLCQAKGHHYIDCIESCKVSQSVDDECPATKHKNGCHYKDMTYTAQLAIVDYVGSSELGIYKDAGTVYQVEKTGSGWAIVSPSINMDLMITPDKVTVSNAQAYQKNDIILLVTAKKGNNVEKTFVVLYQKSLIGDTDLGNLVNGFDYSGLLDGFDYSSLMGTFDFSGLLGGFDLSSMMGGFSGYGNFGGLDTGETENLHDLEGATLMTVTPHRTMELTITLDEQDISKIAEGMKAKVKVEALRGQEFDGEVTKVAISGTNSGGSSKFTAKLRLEAVENMLPGMSATALIDLDTKEDILTLPVAAVCELEGVTVVYTALDKETGEPAAPVEVETGLSDGEQVEILSGLKEGDLVYYSYYDTLEEDTSAKADKFTFG